jgi:proline dehydrogenase
MLSPSGDSQSLFVNASTWGLVLTGRIIRLDARPAVGGNASLLAME